VSVIEHPERSGITTSDCSDEGHVVALVSGTPGHAHRRLPDWLIVSLSFERSVSDHGVFAGCCRARFEALIKA